MSRETIRVPALNFNSILVAICIALGAWNLSETVAIGKAVSASVEKDAGMERKDAELQRQIIELRQRDSYNESAINQANIEIAVLKTKKT